MVIFHLFINLIASSFVITFTLKICIFNWLDICLFLSV